MALDHDGLAQTFKKLDRQLANLRRKPQANHIHQFRTAARRVEAVLTEVVADADRRHRKVVKLVSKLRRRAGRVRDLDVQIAALRSLKLSEQSGLKIKILQTLSGMRAKRERRFLEILDKETVRELRRRLKQVQERFPECLPDPWALTQSKLAAFAAHEGPVNEKLLHRYRIEGKKIRYVAELAADQPKAQDTIAELKRMQDALGEWHDWLTLNTTVSKLLPDNINSPLLAAIRNITRAKYWVAIQAVSTAKANLLGPASTETKVAGPERRSAASAQIAARAVA